MTPDVTGVFVQYGALGAVALVGLYAVAKMFVRITTNADAAVTVERARADRHEDELRRLNTTVQEKLLPVLVQCTQVMGEVLVELREDRRNGRP